MVPLPCLVDWIITVASNHFKLDQLIESRSEPEVSQDDIKVSRGRVCCMYVFFFSFFSIITVGTGM